MDLGASGSESGANQPESGEKKKKKRTGPKLFPSNSLEESIRILTVVREYNAGNPWPPSEVARVLKMGAKANNFYYLTDSARKYGIATGTRDSETIEITTLGKDIVYATSPEREVGAIKQAFLNVELFADVYNHYKGNPLPDIKYTKNTLETSFGIPPEQQDDFVQLYESNLQFLKAKEAELQGKGDKAPANRLETVALGGPGPNSEKLAFVIMPFVEKSGTYPPGFFDEVLRNLITPAAIEAGFRVETAKREGSDIIQSTIVNELLKADLVIADLTEHNPNVLFELGLSIASRRRVCLIRAKGTKPIFDVDNLMRVYDYAPNLWRSTVEVDVPKLSSHIRKTWENRDEGKTYMEILQKA